MNDRPARRCATRRRAACRCVACRRAARRCVARRSACRGAARYVAADCTHRAGACCACRARGVEEGLVNRRAEINHPRPPRPALPAVLLGLALGLGAARPALAQAGKTPKDAPAKDAATKTNLDTAKLLFRQGVDYYNTGDNERALDYFRRSRAAYPSALNAINAAICLERLRR